MRRVRPVPPALPDLSGEWRGGGVTSRPHRGHARGAVERRTGRRLVHRVHGRVRAMPRVRDRLSVGCALRAADGGHTAFPRRGREAHASVAAARHEGPRPPPPAARRRRARWPLHSGCTWFRVASRRDSVCLQSPYGRHRCRRRATTCGSTPAASWTRGCDLCMLPRYECSAPPAWAPRFPGRAATAAVLSTSTLGSPTTHAASLAGSWPRCRVRRRSSSTPPAVVPR